MAQHHSAFYAKRGHGFGDIRRLRGVVHARRMGRCAMVAQIQRHNTVIARQRLLHRAPIARRTEKPVQQH